MWKEKQPLPCEECKCCEHHEYFMAHDCDSLECHKYERTVYVHRPYWTRDSLNGYRFEELHSMCECEKNYLSVFKRLYFRWLCWLRHLSDKKYHREED